jgi:2-deoxy-scyllo-inosamine dehydrogenase (SAM-dependent)
VAFPFLSINIETTDGCNRKCSFCPNSLIDKAAEFMPLGMFADILFQLAEGGYEGRVHLYQRGEPLLDDRLVDWTAMARRILPKCHLYISTNGDYLTRKLAHKLIHAGMNEIEVSHYDGMRMDLVRETSHLFGNVFHYDKQLDNPIGHWFNRGGLVDVQAAMKMDNNFCWWIFRKAGISCRGDYVLCCADWYPGKFGNVKDHTIMELWESMSVWKYREAHIEKRPRTMPMCERCNLLEG